MAVPQIFERFRGINGDANQRIISYLVEDATSDNEALDFVELASPPEYDDLPRTNARIREVTKKSYRLREYDPGGNPGEFIEEQDTTVRDGTYYVDVVYTKQTATGSNPVNGALDKFNTFSFEQSLETARIYQAKYGTSVFNSSPAGAAEPKDPADTLNDVEYRFEGINRRKETYDGADIRLPIGSFAYDFFPARSQINDAYIDRVQKLVGHVNSTPFENAVAGEVLFISASGRRRANQNDWEFNYRFEYRQNTVDEVINVAGGKAIKYSKLGHQYGWMYYLEAPRPTGTGNAPIPVPVQYHVETVYPTADLWNQLFLDLLP